jgi:hypothetical protein
MQNMYYVSFENWYLPVVLQGRIFYVAPTPNTNFDSAPALGAPSQCVNFKNELKLI